MRIFNKVSSSLTWFTFFTLFIIGTLTSISYAISLKLGPIVYLISICLSATIAAFFSIIIIPMRGGGKLRYAYIGLTIGFFFIFFIIDYFIFFHFSKVFSKEILDIVANTNKRESYEFLSTYLTSAKLILFIAGMAIIFSIVWRLAVILSKSKLAKISAYILVAIGIWIWGYCVYGFYSYRNGRSIPQYSFLSRYAYLAIRVINEAKELDDLCEYNKKFLKDYHQSASCKNDSLIICLIIGESHSLFHTDEYGYDKITFPKLKEIKQDSTRGKIVWFTDMITISDHTHNAMQSIFSIYKDKNTSIFGQSIMFPIIFRAKGYRTELYDNQYLEGRGFSFLVNKKLSDILFSFRNNEITTDESLIEQIDTTSHKKLIIAHLMGSHYAYSSRYPHDRFSIYTTADYHSRFSQEQKQILAHYDNSLIYTDHNLAMLIEKLKNKKSVIVYISDHGEEIYDQGKYMGHGNAATRPIPDYQISIPMFIWMSNKYINMYPNKYNQIINNYNRPGITSQIGHLLLDLANENDEPFDSTLSIINPNYQNPKRIVLHSIDYDRIR